MVRKNLTQVFGDVVGRIGNGRPSLGSRVDRIGVDPCFEALEGRVLLSASGLGGDAPDVIDAGGGAAVVAVAEPCGKGHAKRGKATLPEFDAADFVAPAANPYLPLVPGTAQVYEAETDEGLERTVTTVTHDTKEILGVTTVVVLDVETIVVEGVGEVLLEETFDWYAADQYGNVWYFGEDTLSYEYDDDWNLIETTTDGAWEAGVDGALPGILLSGDPKPGLTQYQEFFLGEAEDVSTVMRTNGKVSIGLGEFEGLLVTKESSTLDPGEVEHKYYAEGVGLVYVQELSGGKTVHVELVEVIDSGAVADAASVASGAVLPEFDATQFDAPVSNAYFPLVPGTTYIYEAETDEGLERTVTTVTHDTKEILGVTTVVVHDVETIVVEGVGEVLLEETFDWYATDNFGNVWYFGEDTLAYEYDDDWNLIGTTTDGAWEAGVDGALPGIRVPGDPRPGPAQYQEFLEGEAEDEAKVLKLNASVSIGLGDFDGLLKTKESTKLSPGSVEHKYYAEGIGLIYVEELSGGKTVTVELVEVIMP